MKTLIILGSGASLKDVDFNLLNNQDVFGLNNQYIKFEEMSWYPTYYGCFSLRGSKTSLPDVFRFINENYMKVEKFFFNSEELKNTISKSLSRIKYLDMKPPEKVELDINRNKYSYPLDMEIHMASMLIENPDERKHFLNYIDMLLPFDLSSLNPYNKFGILKLFRKEALDDSCLIDNPRFKLEWYFPKSLEEFTFYGANSAVTACRIGYLLGYKKIILLGVDCRWKIDNNIVDTKNTYWFDNYFKQDYDIREYCSRCTPESLREMHLESWQDFKDSIAANELVLEIVNCTPNSELDIFRKSTLEKEL
jgi:hypothetical protein